MERERERGGEKGIEGTRDVRYRPDTFGFSLPFMWLILGYTNYSSESSPSFLLTTTALPLLPPPRLPLLLVLVSCALHLRLSPLCSYLHTFSHFKSKLIQSGFN